MTAIDGELALRGAMEAAFAAMHDVERHHAGEHDTAWQLAAQDIGVAHAILKTDHQGRGRQAPARGAPDRSARHLPLGSTTRR
jgi:hypothetical protein